MAEDGQGPGLPEVEKIGYVGEVVDGIDSLAVASEGFDDDTKNPNADTPPTSKKDEGLVLFVPPPPTEDCPVCFIPLPRSSIAHITYMVCCGKEMCSACFHESCRVLKAKNAKRAEKKLALFEFLCPFCRAPKAKSDEDRIRRYEKRAEKGDSYAISLLAVFCRIGCYGLAKDLRRSCALFHRAADLGQTDAMCELGRMYALGVDGVSLDETKGREFLERAAKKGHTKALVNLAALEKGKGRAELELTYLRTAAAAGDGYAVKILWKRFREGAICKDDLEESLRAYQKANEDIRSEERERYNQWMKVKEEKEEKEQEGK